MGQAGADKTEVPDLLASVACLAMVLSSLDRLRWSLFFIFNLRRICFVSYPNFVSLVHANSRGELQFLTRHFIREVIRRCVDELQQ